MEPDEHPASPVFENGLNFRDDFIEGIKLRIGLNRAFPEAMRTHQLIDPLEVMEIRGRGKDSGSLVRAAKPFSSPDDVDLISSFFQDIR
ncbi:MAG: hypothetical protein A2V45_13105 [Candidatus Aminicenantes bacterium RBG_19FT_COMBO_58_17]|nr:MAG: hypothetical protein A2V45_13105 [Candidatus Aminicenantes bacterium RBG_19FT_COMBO_58_17]